MLFFFILKKGTLIQHLKEHLLHGNMSREDIIIYYTTVIQLKIKKILFN